MNLENSEAILELTRRHSGNYQAITALTNLFLALYEYQISSRQIYDLTMLYINPEDVEAEIQKAIASLTALPIKGAESTEGQTKLEEEALQATKDRIILNQLVQAIRSRIDNETAYDCAIYLRELFVAVGTSINILPLFHETHKL